VVRTGEENTFSDVGGEEKLLFALGQIESFGNPVYRCGRLFEKESKAEFVTTAFPISCERKSSTSWVMVVRPR